MTELKTVAIVKYDTIITFRVPFVFSLFIGCYWDELKNCCSQPLEIPLLLTEITDNIDHIEATKKIPRFLKDFPSNIIKELLFIEDFLLKFSFINIVINVGSYKEKRFLHGFKLFRQNEVIIFKISFSK